MSESHKKQLEQQLWNIANTLRGKMGADEFRDYILGFIFFKYLSERMGLYANKLLEEDGITYNSIKENTSKGKEYLEAVRKKYFRIEEIEDKFELYNQCRRYVN